MWTKILLVLILPMVLNSEIRRPAFAGSFYPAKRAELLGTINKFLDAVKPESKKRVYCLIAPHAGYVYSGEIAAWAFKRVADEKYDSIVIIGLSHRAHIPGPSIYPEGQWETPLGRVNIDKKLAAEIMKNWDKIQYYPEGHTAEHSIEVIIPFIQVLFENVPVVPITVRNFDLKICETLAEAIYKAIKDKNVLVVASSDMCHYPAYSHAVEVDKKTLSLIKKFDTEALWRQELKVYESRIPDLHCYLCNVSGVITVMNIAKKFEATKVEIIKYQNSGDVPFGNKSSVVGYCAVAFTK